MNKYAVYKASSCVFDKTQVNHKCPLKLKLNINIREGRARKKKNSARESLNLHAQQVHVICGCHTWQNVNEACSLPLSMASDHRYSAALNGLGKSSG